MLYRVNKISNIGRFEHLQSDNGTQGAFSRLNVIYAPNGCGKSTLCDVFRSLGSQDGRYILGRQRFRSTCAPEIELVIEDNPKNRANFTDSNWSFENEPKGHIKVIVYDQRFVSENVIIGHHVAVEQRRNFYGLTIGQKAVKLNEVVRSAGDELEIATSEYNSAESELRALLPAGYSIQDFVKLAVEDDLDSKLEKAIKDLEEAKSQSINVVPIKQRKLLQLIDAPSIPPFTEMLEAPLDDVALNAENLILNHIKTSAPTLSIDWIRQGHQAQLDDACPHCGQTMTNLELLKAYRAFFSGVIEQQKSQRDLVRKELKLNFGEAAIIALKNKLESHAAEAEWWGSKGVNLNLTTYSDIPATIEAMRTTYHIIEQALQRKEQSPGTKVHLTPEESNSINQYSMYYALLLKYKAHIIEVNNVIVNHQKNIESIDITQLEKRLKNLQNQKKRESTEVVDCIERLTAAREHRSNKSTEKKEANDALRTECQNILKAYGDRINEILKSFRSEIRVNSEVTFKGGVSTDVQLYIRDQKISNTLADSQAPELPSLANTISGGDRSALALAFFLAIVEKDPELENTIVVFDDPFHSQDRSRRHCTIELIQKLSERSAQTFILSHELEFARMVSNHRGLGNSIKTFKLHPDSEPRTIKYASLDSLASDSYRKDYKTINDFLNDSASDISGLTVARCMRQVLEKYLRVKFPNAGFEPPVWLGGMIDKIREAPVGSELQQAKRLLDDLSSVNEWSQNYHHAEESLSCSIDSAEARTFAERTLGIIHK